VAHCFNIFGLTVHRIQTCMSDDIHCPWTIECTRVFTSRRPVFVVTREGVHHYWMSRYKPLSSTLFIITVSQLIFLSLMRWEITWIEGMVSVSGNSRWRAFRSYQNNHERRVLQNLICPPPPLQCVFTQENMSHESPHVTWTRFWCWVIGDTIVCHCHRKGFHLLKWKWWSMTFTVISDNDNIIDWNKWHFHRFLNPCLFEWNKWHFNGFLNPYHSRFWDPTNLRSISYKYYSPKPLTHSSPSPSI
jgi:hypothetical protein